MNTVQVKVPELSESVSEATLLEWKRKPGDIVAADEILIEIETDKVVLEVPSPAAGQLAEIRAQNGQTVVSGEVIAVIDTDASVSASASTDSSRASSPAPVKETVAEPRVMPSAAAVLDAAGIDAKTVIGTGPGNRITKVDALAAAESSVPPKIAEFAHRHGLKVFYYIAPKVWASREGRIRKLKAFVDRLFIVFPFEIPYFKSRGVDFIYKGNPLVDAVDNSAAMKETREDFLRRNTLEDKPVIAMLAGSRKPEISSMMPVLAEFARKMHSLPQYSGYQFLIAGAPARTIEDYSPWLDPSEDYVKVLFGETQSIIRHAEAAVVNSGTASLETVLFNVPQVVGYRVNWLTYIVGKHIIKVHYISLGNLCLDRLAFRELIQDDCNADEILKEVRALIEDREYREKMLACYTEIRHLLGGTGASLSVAGAMVDILSGSGATEQ